MPYERVEISDFRGGLNYADQPNNVPPNEAIDAMNVNFTDDGRISRRTGYTLATTGDGGDSAIVWNGQLVIGGPSDNKVKIYNFYYSSYTLLATLTGSAMSSPQSFRYAAFGGPTTSLLFIANGIDQLASWDGTTLNTAPTWTLGSGTYAGVAPKPKFVAVTPWDNRLVGANFPQGTQNQGNNSSTVRFSAEGDPLAWRSNYFEDVLPGDGEPIMGMCVWRDSLFVFKQTKFFRFYGTTVDADGYPTFDYMTVNTGIGLMSQNGLVSCEDAVYFVSSNGLYKTSGGPPVEVSKKIRPLFNGIRQGTLTMPYNRMNDDAGEGHGVNPVYNSLFLCNSYLSRVSDRLLAWNCIVNTANGRKTLVYDRKLDCWTVWDVLVVGAAFDRNSSFYLTHFCTDQNNIYYFGGGSTTDNGTPIAARVQLGWSKIGENRPKRIRQTEFVGTGIAEADSVVDFDQRTVAEMATNTKIWSAGNHFLKKSLVRRAVRGLYVSPFIKDWATTPQAWELERVVYYAQPGMVDTTGNRDGT